MSECFVIQPFDNDKFDKRYVDTFEPAIKNAGLEPYRVDKDLAVNDLVEGIKDGIDRASAVLADLTTDNPNVWYELGHAIARGKPFCLICSDERQGKYPFDIGHLKVVLTRPVH
jgi:nucleoside 2-deoxyribosyltransferase